MTPPDHTEQINARIPPPLADWLARTARSKSEGAGQGLAGWHLMVEGSLRELTGAFSQGEARILLAALNGCWLTSGLGQHVELSVEDAIAFGAAETFGVDAALLLTKLSELTLAQKIALEIWATQFWRGRFDDESHKARWIARLTGETK